MRQSRRQSGSINHDDVENAVAHSASDTASNSQQSNAVLTNHDEEKKAHSQCT